MAPSALSRSLSQLALLYAGLGAPPAGPSGHTPGVKNWQRPLLGVVAAVAVTVLALGAEPARAEGGKDDAPAQPAPAKKKRGEGAQGGEAAVAKPEKSKEASPEERAARGVVALERAGQQLGLGAVLSGDGRILTALSPLGHGNDIDARFADGSTVRVKLGHHDRMWDLALLVPQTGRWPEGLTASSRDPVRDDATIRSFTLTKGKATPLPVTLRAYRSLLGGDDRTLERAIEIGSRISPADLGAPIVDEDGRVVALLGRACAPADKGPCIPVAFGIPVTAIRGFLKSVPPSAVAPSAWLGIQGLTESTGIVRGVRVATVHPDSPAEEAKLRDGDRSIADVIVAVDGVPVTSPEALAEEVRSHAVGEKVPLLVFGQNRFRTVTVTLRPGPEARSGASGGAHPAELPPLERGQKARRARSAR